MSPVQAPVGAYARRPATGLHDPAIEHSSCGVGFITRKDSTQTHEVLTLAHRALCTVPHRGGMSAEGIGDGAGVSIDLSVRFFSALSGRTLTPGRFGVGNFFLPAEEEAAAEASALIDQVLGEHGLQVLTVRDVPIDADVVRPAALAAQLPIRQWIFTVADVVAPAAIDRIVHEALLAIEAMAFTDPRLRGLHPLCLSVRTQVLKGRLNSGELMRFFTDLLDERHEVRSLFFHTRFSTNTDPHPTMAQPFRLMAHNGELNTDRKNRIAETAIARARGITIIRPPGQSDSCRLDQTLHARVAADGADLLESIVVMMPPAWENDPNVTPAVRAMLEWHALAEEKNDGPAAVVFGDGEIIGARLDRLGLRPLRTVETDDYLCAMSEAGQFGFDPATEIRRGRIEAGGMLHYDHRTQRAYTTGETLEILAARRDYAALLAEAKIDVTDIPSVTHEVAEPERYHGDFSTPQRYVAYSLNAESFRFLLDPMLATGAEKVSAMGYGNAINVLTDGEGGAARYFSQRFAQVTNPPLDSLREADGMTLRVALGAKRHPGEQGGADTRQLVVPSPVLTHADMLRIAHTDAVPHRRFSLLHAPVDAEDAAQAAECTTAAIDALAAEVVAYARAGGGIAILSDRHVSSDRAALPLIMAIAAVNQALVEARMRLRVSVVAESGQIPSAHHVATALGFGAAAVYPLSVRLRAEETYGQGPEADAAFARFAKAAEKSLMKTMGRVGLCTAESYIGGEFFEPNFLDCDDPVLRRWFPNQHSPVGGVDFEEIARTYAAWHVRARSVRSESDIPLLGLFKERSDGAGHSFGTTAVRAFVDLTEQPVRLGAPQPSPSGAEQRHEVGEDELRFLTLDRLGDSFGVGDEAYDAAGYGALSADQMDSYTIPRGYRSFVRTLAEERERRPAALRDVLAMPADLTFAHTADDFTSELGAYSRHGNAAIAVRGLSCDPVGAAESEGPSRGVDGEDRDGPAEFLLRLTSGGRDLLRLDALAQSLLDRFGADLVAHWLEAGAVRVRATGAARAWLELLREAPASIEVGEVELASAITPTLASGAMSHGALVSSAHEAVAHGTNMIGGMSNCGEGGEHLTRYGTVRGSRIKQFASGRFGVWAGYLADPMLRELEIKIGQGAKPGEGGQLPAPKVSVEIAAARGGTPGVELVSPPPHHDTYSIEDLAQLIHDCKAARVRVIVKLVSSEGIGTIAVGVAKAGADVINVAGNTGGTGAASVTSLKYAGRAAELGVAEVHQALSLHGLRSKVLLRCSGAHQTGRDVMTSALLGADSFEFGTAALMMLKCVMAKNCNVKCPAGLTTNSEAFDGDPKALAAYLLCIAHETREWLARLGLRSLREARGRSDLLALLDHPSSVGQLDVRRLLARTAEVVPSEPVYLEKDFSIDDDLGPAVFAALLERGEEQVHLAPRALGNTDKTVGGQLAIDIERRLNHEDRTVSAPAVLDDERGRRYLAPASVLIDTTGSAGQSYGAFCNDGMLLRHLGTCNDGVGKGACGGEIAVRTPGGGATGRDGNVLIGNFALFGATGGRLFVAGGAGDRFAVRNSGATAVVEGTGDFACEYMTNGAVLNLGTFGKGVGNGMSGGFLYQYDPDALLEGAASTDSVILSRLDGEDPMSAVHRDAVRLLLGWHVEATDSALGARLLAELDDHFDRFWCATPRALLLYQDEAAIAAAAGRKELLEELAMALATDQVRRFRADYRDARPVLGGVVPVLGEPANEEAHALLNMFTVMQTAQDLAATRLRGVAGSEPVTIAARKLILTADHGLVTKLAVVARAALGAYDDTQIATLVAGKRVADYKRALAGRNVRSMDSPGTYGWLLHRDAQHRRIVADLPGLEELFARAATEQVVLDLAARSARPVAGASA